MAKLVDEMRVNLEYNNAFKAFCEKKGVVYTNSIYGCQDIALYKIPDTRAFVREFKQTVSKVWYKSAWEWGESVEAMPFGGWSENEEVAFLKSLRKEAA